MLNLTQKVKNIPRFLSCVGHDEPELNYILHSNKPQFLTEVIEYAGEKEFEKLKKLNSLVKEVQLNDGETDVLIVTELYDKEYFSVKSEVESIKEMQLILEDMAKWHIKEMEDLENY